MEKVRVSGNCVAVDYWDYVELEKRRPITIGYANLVEINLKCNE